MDPAGVPLVHLPLHWHTPNWGTAKFGRDKWVQRGFFTDIHFGLFFFLQTVLRVWDCLFYEGSKVLFRAALTLIIHHQPEILRARSLSDVCECFRQITCGAFTLDCHAFTQVRGEKWIKAATTDTSTCEPKYAVYYHNDKVRRLEPIYKGRAIENAHNSCIFIDYRPLEWKAVFIKRPVCDGWGVYMQIRSLGPARRRVNVLREIILNRSQWWHSLKLLFSENLYRTWDPVDGNDR